MNSVLYMVKQKNRVRGVLVAMTVAVYCQTGNSSEALFKDVENSERALAAVRELNDYYAEAPGFKYAKAVSIDTGFLETRAVQLGKRERSSSLPAERLGRYQSEGVLEWEGTLPESSGKLALTRIEGKFYGSYQAKEDYHIITTYKSGGRWMTMMLVYDSRPPECGTEMQVNEKGEEDTE